MRLSLLATFFINAFAIAFAQNPLPQFEIATVKSPGRRIASSRCTTIPAGES